ncbi:MAG TPA: PEP/pyruvate-binding domain-containing protein, partial [Propionibacteriaceae bacterium]
MSARAHNGAVVVPLRSPAATLATAGGKGKNLSQLARAGFPVPAGFVVTTAAYRAFVQETGLQPRILGLAKGDPQGDVEEVSAEIRGLFEGGGIPSNVASEIGQAHSALCSDGQVPIPLAVRSSATAEDLPGASFAGQQETYLNVCGEQDLLRAVKRCWSSLWTPRALAYRRRQGIDPGAVGLAVVVQVMVSASAAGVLFTANPLTGARDEVVIDAAWGLGEAVVSGLVTPDHIVVDKATSLVKQIAVAEKPVLTLPTSGGTEQRAVEADKRSAQVLDTAQVAQLVRLGSSIETHYNEPQDIEWCLAGDQFWIVQSRPITTLPPEPIIWQSPVPGAKWLKDLQAAEWVTEPVSPLGATTTFAAMIAARQRRMPLQRSPWYAVINGWLYMRADFRLLWLATAPIGLAVNLAKGTLNGHRRMRRRWPDRLRMLALLEKSDLAKLSDEELRVHTERLLAALGWWWWEVTWYTAAAQLGEQVLRKLKVADLADPAVLFRGNDSLLLEAERALRHAADTGQVEAYLARFGHFVESADPIHPTLRESPELLTQYLAVARHSDIGPDERLIRTRRERAAAETLVHAVRGPRGFVERRMLNIGQSCAAHVDDAVFHLQRVLALIRAAFLEAGWRLSVAGTLEAADDVFYLERDQVWTPKPDQASHVAQRRQLRERHKRLAPPPFIPPPDDPSWTNDRQWRLWSSLAGPAALKRGAQDRNGRRVLVGAPGSPGRAHGIARLIARPDEFHRLQPGDVLITHATTPIWTPLFNIAAAAVTEVGGPFSHAAIVAREFGIPLVNGAVDATRDIADGTSIVVDGSAGIVELTSTTAPA